MLSFQAGSACGKEGEEVLAQWPVRPRPVYPCWRTWPGKVMPAAKRWPGPCHVAASARPASASISLEGVCFRLSFSK